MATSTTKRRQLHAHIWEREEDDWHVEPEWCSKRLFEEERFEGSVYDPAAGRERIVVSARKAGLKSYGSDLVDRGLNCTRTPHDFLASPDDERHDNIVTNVPFCIAQRFAQRALKLARHKVAMLFPLARLNAAHWMEDTPLAKVLLLTPRPSMPPGRVILAGEKPGGGKVDFCWVIWSHGHVGKREWGWLHRDRATIKQTVPAMRAAE
jgi:hypothetical protein